ncbi:flagellar protein FlaG [Thermosulfurimonas marina]|uniref:Flagellar protein FlaG n=1 Tax=Thermosulfurimonas marina TaxID=2047767 RepID=A0A6H1WTM2_9BACT|nr:flagellar protein FlaG [Thermosulfurimonas marina]QJA06553.1 flagellar protein FlaG [Thermosulfurimonas marina]
MRVANEIRVLLPQNEKAHSSSAERIAPEAAQTAWLTSPKGLSRIISAYQREAEGENRSRSPSPEELKRILEELSRRLDPFSKYLKIEIDQDLDIPVVKIVDKETNQVIRQIPPEYLVKLWKNLERFLSGILVNERV